MTDAAIKPQKKENKNQIDHIIDIDKTINNDQILINLPIQSAPYPYGENQYEPPSLPQNSVTDAAYHLRSYGDSDLNQSLQLPNPLEGQIVTLTPDKIQDLMNLNKRNGLFIEKNTPLTGQHAPFLSPPAFLNVDQRTPVLDEKIDADTLNPFIIEATSAAIQKKETESLFQGFSKNPEQSFSKDPQHIEAHQNMLMQTPQQFVQYIKDQFDRFKSSKEKKITFHLREDGKNLTMIFDMIGENKVDVIFRTTDKIWQKKLQDHHESLQEALQGMDNTIHIRYLGE